MDIFLTGLDANGSLISKLYKNNGNETFTETENSFTGAWLGDAAWGDYNSDGYPDIVLAGATFTNRIAEVYKNNGDGTFSFLSQAGLTGVSHASTIWGDYDNDGDLDIFICGTYEQGGGWPRVTDVYINNGDDTFTEAGLDFAVDCFWGEAAWGDYDADGDLDLICSGHDDLGGSNTIIYRNDNTSVNSAPATPQNLVSEVIDNNISLSWDASTDSETPSPGLSYNAYIKTNTGNIIWNSMSDINNGYRLLPALGNTSQDLSWTINGLDDGDYFWSVQALDNNFEGSAFATEEGFTIGTIGINNPAQKVNISPNPSNGVFKIRFGGTQNLNQFTVTDLQGRVVHTISSSSKEISLDLTAFGKGVYFIRIISGSESMTEKVVVE